MSISPFLEHRNGLEFLVVTRGTNVLIIRRGSQLFNTKFREAPRTPDAWTEDQFLELAQL